MSASSDDEENTFQGQVSAYTRNRVCAFAGINGPARPPPPAASRAPRAPTGSFPGSASRPARARTARAPGFFFGEQTGNRHRAAAGTDGEQTGNRHGNRQGTDQPRLFPASVGTGNRRGTDSAPPSGPLLRDHPRTRPLLPPGSSMPAPPACLSTSRARQLRRCWQQTPTRPALSI